MDRLRKLLVLPWLGLASVGSGCATSVSLDDPSFDLWCGEELCKWRTDEGRIERVGTWNRNDYGVSFTATPTQISQLRENAPLECMLIETVADVAASARVSIKVDFGDDGTPEFEQLVAEARWAKLRFELPPPNQSGRPVRFMLRKEGRGRAVLAHLRVSISPGCPEAHARPDGASCISSSTCASGRCSDGLCARCTVGGCGEGISCEMDEQCASGHCLAGRCRSCGLHGSCPAFSACTLDSHCASGLCQKVLAPSRLDGPLSLTALGLSRQCAQCRQDADCGTGRCQHGACAGCRSDADCGDASRCRYSELFDATERSCSPALEVPRVRGGLCERDEDCSDGLRCAAVGEQPRRCGRACSSAAQDCSSDGSEVCLPSSLSTWAEVFTVDWSDLQSRVPTCQPREALNVPDGFVAPAR
jgi:hypothetical protein